MSNVIDPVYGEICCQATLVTKKTRCENKAYWKVILDDNVCYYCGVHSRKYADNREELKKDKVKTQQLKQEKMEIAKKEAESAKANNGTKRGKVMVSKFQMMYAPEHVPGFVKVFPNYRHGNRKDGLGMPKLSPKSMGPIDHGQPGLPQAKNLENFHQGNKVFSTEVDEKGNPSKEFYQTQLEMYESEMPQRHKDRALDSKGKRINAPLFSLWRDKDGVEHRLSYFDSRELYCKYYERIAKTTDEYKKLMDMLKDGYNIQIIGYDGYDVGKRTISECYKDVSRPFGHELVLYAMLALPEKQWPWRREAGLHVNPLLE